MLLFTYRANSSKRSFASIYFYGDTFHDFCLLVSGGKSDEHESSFPYDSKLFASISFSLAEMKMAVNTKLRIYRLNHLLRGVKKKGRSCIS